MTIRLTSIVPHNKFLQLFNCVHWINDGYTNESFCCYSIIDLNDVENKRKRLEMYRNLASDDLNKRLTSTQIYSSKHESFFI